MIVSDEKIKQALNCSNTWLLIVHVEKKNEKRKNIKLEKYMNTVEKSREKTETSKFWREPAIFPQLV